VNSTAVIAFALCFQSAALSSIAMGTITLNHMRVRWDSLNKGILMQAMK
jgi:hypothetical protein